MVNRLRFAKKPSFVLGFLLLAVWICFLFLWCHDLGVIPAHPWVKPLNLDKNHWIVLIGVLAAVTGWVVTSIITVRNSIKQHTINTLLQSRLSAMYMEQVRAVNRRYLSFKGIRPITREEIARSDPEAQIPALAYILNYVEFVAVGIRAGDLDESLMKETIRGMVCSVREVADEFISMTRESLMQQHPPAQKRRFLGLLPPAKSHVKIYEHLDWLYARWFDPKLKRPVVQLQPIAVPIVAEPMQPSPPPPRRLRPKVRR